MHYVMVQCVTQQAVTSCALTTIGRVLLYIVLWSLIMLVVFAFAQWVVK